MIVCPVCQSSKIRNGYRKAPLPLRLFFIRAFLCESCNLEFHAFALRPAKSRLRRGRRKAVAPSPPKVEAEPFPPPMRPLHAEQPTAQPAPRFDWSAVTPPAPLDDESLDRGSQAQDGGDAVAGAERAGRHHASHHSSQPDRSCPHCGSRDTRRRHRKLWERMVFGLTSIRAYSCLACGAPFYARRVRKPPMRTAGSAR
jgi:hypothetical protein